MLLHTHDDERKHFMKFHKVRKLKTVCTLQVRLKFEFINTTLDST